MEEDFEVIYDEARCHCRDEGLDWEWDGEEMLFSATCSCFKKHCIRPITCKLIIEKDESESDDD